MFPTFQQHLGRYGLALWLGVSLLSLLLTFSLVRNSQTLGLLELLLAGAAIAGGLTFGAFRDAPGYWIYSTLAAKFMLSKDELEQLSNLRFSRLVGWLSPLHNPLSMPLLVVGLVLLLLLAGNALFPAHRSLLAFTIIGLLFPLLLCWLLLGSARYFLALASPEGENVIRQTLRPPRQASGHRRDELCISLVITFALIWPLQSKPAFSLAAGYADPKFIVAALLLGWIAAFFTLLSARRSRLYSLVGERLSALFCAVPPTPPRPTSLGLVQRLLLYYAMIGLWVLALCLALSLLPTALPFPLFCLLLLPVLGWVFWRERGLTLQRDFAQAAQFIEEQAVMPVAVPRRMHELS
jgi:hypothetical protein